MAASGYRVELESLSGGGRRLHDLSDEMQDSITAPLAPPAGGNEGFASSQAALAVAEAWEAEVRELAAVLRAAGDKLTETAAQYDRADVSAEHGFQRILSGG